MAVPVSEGPAGTQVLIALTNDIAGAIIIRIITILIIGGAPPT